MSTQATPETLLRTPLYDHHKELNARLVPFAGFEMPVQYTGLIDEHNTVRNAVGIFDVSHMGIAKLNGPRAKEFLNYALTRDFSAIQPNNALYTLLLRDHGGTVDDLIVYCEAENSFYMVLNASNKDKDLAYLKELNEVGGYGCTFESLFDSYSLLAIQGPKAQEVLKALGADFDLSQSFKFDTLHLGAGRIEVKVASTGYTGEKGCEIFVDNLLAPSLWKDLLTVGAPFGIKAIGLGARDTLRTEMGYSLYGHELGEDINPIEAGLKWAVGMNKPNFVGKKALEEAVKNPQRKMVSLKVNSKQSPRPDMKVADKDGNVVGKITSGTFAPSLGYSVGLALVSAKSEGPLPS